jgi:hypothetical protein
MRNGNAMQAKLAASPLFRTVKAIAYEVRDSHEYDMMSEEDRRLAVLCVAIERLLAGKGISVERLLEEPG